MGIERIIPVVVILAVFAASTGQLPRNGVRQSSYL